MASTAPTRPPTDQRRLVLLSLILAVAAVVLLNGYVEWMRRQASEASFTVYRLNRSLRAGDTLTERDVDGVSVPMTFREAFNDAVTEDGLAARIGETLRRQANRNDILRHDLFTAPTTQAFAQMITTGKRLVTIPVDRRSQPGYLRPGMFVDVEALFSGSGGATAVLPVLERVRVMAVGDWTLADEQASGDSGGPRRGYETISIEVSPQQATALAMIRELAVSDFILFVRNPGATETPKIPTGGINPEVMDLLRSRATMGRLPE